MKVPSLTPLDLAFAGVFSLLFAALSLAAGLGLGRAYVIGLGWMVVQLAAVGLVLKFAVEQAEPWWTMAVAALMLAVATVVAAGRLAGRIGRATAAALGGSTLALVGGLGTLVLAGALVAAEPWWSPQIALPLLAVVLGTSVSALDLTLSTLVDAVERERHRIEMRLALGHTRLAALAEPLRQAVRAGLTPTLNGLAAAGVVSVPGLMTGQIIAGVDPIEAAKYQIVILAVLAGATALAVAMAALGGLALVTDHRHRLRPPRVGIAAKAEAGPRAALARARRRR